MSQPPSYQTNIFNSSYFTATNGTLTITTADKRYVKIGSNAFLTSVVLGGNTITSTEAGYLTSITAGTAAPSKALILDGTRSATNIYSMTFDSSGTGLIIPNLKFWDASGLTSTNFDHSQYISLTQGLAGPQKAMVLNLTKDFSGVNSFGCATLTASTSVSTPSVGCDTLTSRTGTLNINPTTLNLRGTAITSSATQLNYVNVSEGSAAPSKALVLDSSGDIIGIDSLAATTLRSSVSAPGRILTNTSPVSDYNIIVANSSNIDTCTSSICFLTNTDADFANMTPSAAIVASRAGTATYAGCRIDIISKKSAYEATKLGMVQRRMSLHGDNLISFGPKDGDRDLNLLSGGTNAAFRFGSALSTQNCITQQFVYSGPSSDSNYLSWDWYGTSGCLTLYSNINIVIGSTGSRTSKLCVIGNGNNLYGSWKRTLRLENDNATPMGYEVLIYNESGGTNSNGIVCGSMTNDPIGWMVNGTTCMTLNTSKRLSVNKSAGPEATIHAGGMIWADELFHSKQNVDGKCVYRTNWSQANYLGWGTDATVGAMRLGIADANFNWVSYVPVRGGSYTNASDRRLKKDIVDLPYGLEEVLRMKPRRFIMRDSNKACIGFIAQEMQPLIPELVEGGDDQLNDDGLPINPMGIDLSSLTSVLCKAIQELKAEVEILKKDRVELRAIIEGT